LGVAELLIRLRLAGGRIIEYPTTLESRLFGESKMKILRTIGRHLGLLYELITTPRSPSPGVPEPLPGSAPSGPTSPSASASIASRTSSVKLP
ncbi:MAG TPA: hypothetical protein VMU54_12435, partial [Planctomycetota bacterium]|nr:hypothetical protein [Planctomycetota bacterium]